MAIIRSRSTLRDRRSNREQKNEVTAQSDRRIRERDREAEALYLQALPILSAKLEESHQWRQEASQRFRSLLQKAIQENRTDELSDDPMTQSILQDLQSNA